VAKSLSIQEKTSYATNAFASLGIGKEAAFGVLGSLAGESGRGLNTGAFNPKDPNGGSVGVAQWHSDRRTAMENFQSRWGSPRDFRHQIDFVVHELKTTHKGVADKLAKDGMTRAKAASVWTKEYERPAKAYEHIGTRQQNATYFSKMDAGRPRSPQEAIDRTSPTKNLEAIAQATATLAAGTPIGVTGAIATAAAQQPATQTVAQAAAPAAAAPGFDFERFGPAVSPNMSVAYMDRPVDPANPTTNVAAFDMERFGPQMAPATALAVATSPTPAQALAAFASPANPNAGQPISLNREAVAYVDPVVSSVAGREAKSTTKGAKDVATTPGAISAPAKASSTVEQKVSPMESLFGGITSAISNVNPTATAVNTATTPKSQEVAADASGKAAASGAKTQETAKSGIAGFMSADATVGAFLGSMVGGYLGGPLGAIAGGLAGQGIQKGIEGLGPEKAKAKEEDDGMAGGITRSLDGFFGGLGGMLGLGKTEAIQYSGDVNAFPDAPDRPTSGADFSQFSAQQMDSAGSWADSHESEMNSPGLY
jgi:hypothetical protein